MINFSVNRQVPRRSYALGRARFVHLAAVAAMFSISVACGESTANLRVDLRTDYVPGVEFHLVDVAIENGPRRERPWSPTVDYIQGTRVADFDALPEGPARVIVSLFHTNGARVARRVVLVDVRGTLGVTVTLDRRCLEVTCAPDESCIAGQCASEECLDGTQAACEIDACDLTTCANGLAACAEAECVGGVCLQHGNDTACPGEEYCAPREGCLRRPTADVDAGEADAGAADAATDTLRTDTGTGDTGPGDAGATDTGPIDTGAMDTGPSDSGSVDSSPVDSSPVDAPVDAGSADADAQPPDAVDSGLDETVCDDALSGALLCDGFEGGLGDWDRPREDDGMVRVTTDVVYRGGSALEVSVNGTGSVGRASISQLFSPISSADTWVRAYFYIPSATYGDEISLLAVGELSINGESAATGFSIAETWLWTTPNDDAVGPTLIPMDTWFCLQLHVTAGAAGRLEVFYDGASAATLAADTTLSDGFEELIIGIERAGTAQTAPVVLYVDEVAVDRAMLSCD